MAARVCSLVLLLLMVVLPLGACKKDEQATATMAELSALTDQLVTTVRDAPDKKAGVAEAQALLDERRQALATKLAALGQLKSIELSDEAQAAVLNTSTDAMAKMARLEEELLAEIFEDEALEAALETLIEDHEALVKGR
ncbi:MAG: hypothetical protein AAGF11_35420 [Myxococcota bacterium]